ncbi:hypothetical protein MTsPCn9_04670 [Croceitalea sp. MTPC9]|uniref:hypothetical protein n=1 Tax=unclassified Croceitalea TaxID=2632280 RepID=UPI002B394156|nr:hypothetical protein MTsPCn6_04040 [Croceitalea sp. MTPC6]GMN15531.1 hypothetical protein MTsPCn9_04670 [Croceitalea sp. MTPC9]
MILQKTNIEDKLLRLKSKSSSENKILSEVQKILAQDFEGKIENRLASSSQAVDNQFVFDLLETDKIYHIEQIKRICTDYRLRFLDSKYFKGKIPQKAISKIKHLEKEHNMILEGFKIMAPSKLFKLEDKDDPLLFAPIGNGYFYLIHKWGNDLHPMRKLLVWPFKGMINLTITTLVVSYFAAILVPDGLFSKSNSNAQFWILFFFMFKTIGAIVIYYAFAQGKNFNPAIWNSKYFNG